MAATWSRRIILLWGAWPLVGCLCPSGCPHTYAYVNSIKCTWWIISKEQREKKVEGKRERGGNDGDMKLGAGGVNKVRVATIKFHYIQVWDVKEQNKPSHSYSVSIFSPNFFQRAEKNLNSSICILATKFTFGNTYYEHSIDLARAWGIERPEYV